MTPCIKNKPGYFGTKFVFTCWSSGCRVSYKSEIRITNLYVSQEHINALT